MEGHENGITAQIKISALRPLLLISLTLYGGLGLGLADGSVCDSDDV